MELIVIDSFLKFWSEEIEAIKALAVKLKIPVIVTVKLFPIVDHREDLRPLVKDLPLSERFERLADLIIFLYRASYYECEYGKEVTDKVEVIVARNRWGDTGIVDLKFNYKKLEFRDIYP